MQHTNSITIHIGFHKSASTYLQQYLFPKLPVNYLFLSNYKREILNMVESADHFNEEALREWVANKTNAKYQKPHALTVISHEELSGHPHGYAQVDPTVVAANLKQAFPAAKILIIIRDQFSYMLSLYTFRVAIKGLETRNLETFLNEEGGLGLFEKLDYDRLVERYASLFGRENVLTLPMEMLKKDSQTFNNAVTDFLGVAPIPWEAVKPVNESTKLVAVLQFWRPLNFCFRSFLSLCRLLQIQPEEEYPYYWLRYKYYGLQRRATSRLNQLLEDGAKIDIDSYSGYKELETRYATSNTRLQKLVKVSLKECGYSSGE